MYPELQKTNCIDKYFAFDINKSIMMKGLKIIKEKTDGANIIIEHGHNFNFENIPDRSINIAFCQAVCSHLNLNSQIIMFRNLYSKMKKDNSKLYCSYLLFENDTNNEPYDYTWKENRNLTERITF